MASGYWNNPEATECTFRAYLKDTVAGALPQDGGPWAFSTKGSSSSMGRLKDILILRGRNVYPQDIERTGPKKATRACKGCNAAFAVDVHENGVVLLQELTSDYEALDEEVADEISSSIRTAARRSTTGFVHRPRAPEEQLLLKTTSGKIQRRPGRREYLAGLSRGSPGSPASNRAEDREDARGGRTSDVR